MPSTSEDQRKLMEAAAADPKVAKRTGVPQKVAKEYRAADRARLRKGGKKLPKKKPSARASVKRAVQTARNNMDIG